MNCVCALLYLDSMRKPWSVENIISIIDIQIMHNTFHAEKAIFLGKSYGGLLAHEFTINYPKKVISLVLFAPASANKASIERLCSFRPAIPIFLGWTGDDGSFSHRTKFQHNCKQKEFEFYSEFYGGHAITEEYYDPITKFLEQYHKRS